MWGCVLAGQCLQAPSTTRGGKAQPTCSQRRKLRSAPLECGVVGVREHFMVSLPQTPPGREEISERRGLSERALTRNWRSGGCRKTQVPGSSSLRIGIESKAIVLCLTYAARDPCTLYSQLGPDAKPTYPKTSKHRCLGSSKLWAADHSLTNSSHGTSLQQAFTSPKLQAQLSQVVCERPHPEVPGALKMRLAVILQASVARASHAAMIHLVSQKYASISLIFTLEACSGLLCLDTMR